MQATVSKVNSVYCVVLHRLPICKSESIDLLPSKLITGIRSLGPNKGVDTKPISKPAWGKIDMIYIFLKLVYGFSKYAQSWGKETFHGQSLTYRKWGSVILLLSFFNLLYSYVSSFIQKIKLSVEDQLMRILSSLFRQKFLNAQTNVVVRFISSFIIFVCSGIAPHAHKRTDTVL